MNTYKTITLPVAHKSLVAQYPNFSTSGSIAGMKERFYGKTATLVRCGSSIYNVPFSVYSRAGQLASNSRRFKRSY